MVTTCSMRSCTVSYMNLYLMYLYMNSYIIQNIWILTWIYMCMYEFIYELPLYKFKLQPLACFQVLDQHPEKLLLLLCICFQKRMGQLRTCFWVPGQSFEKTTWLPCQACVLILPSANARMATWAGPNLSQCLNFQLCFC